MLTQALRRRVPRPRPAVIARPEPLEPRLLLSAELLRDINTGGVGSGPVGFTEYRGALYFAANGPAGREVYRSDGPNSGATLLKDIAPGIADSDPENFAVVGDTLYFGADGHDGAGVELWKTDGTAAGTVRVSDINPGAADSFPRAIADLKGTAFFAATAPGAGEALFRSDGTAAGTTMVYDPDATSETLGPGEIVPGGDKLFFTGRGDETHVGRLFVTDGTPAGTQQLATFTTWTGVGGLTPFGDKLLFTGFNVAPGHNQFELWSSDGTPQGTQPVIPGSAHDITVVGDVAYYLGNGSLYKTDGTLSGTVHLASAYVDNGIDSNNLVVMDGKVFFSAVPPSATSATLWRSDGTPEGTVPVKSLSSIVDLTASGGKLFFGSTGGLWTSDGTEAGTALLQPMGNNPYQLRRFGNGVAFVGRDTPEGEEPWYSDGTAAGTHLLADVNPADRDSGLVVTNAAAPVSLPNGRVVFTADAGGATARDFDLWSTDGTPLGTVMLADFQRVDAIAVLNGVAYVLATEAPATPTGAARPGLWRTDGTVQGTTKVADVAYDLSNGPTGGWSGLVGVNGVLYFSADNPAGSAQRFGNEIWRSDGTAAGTYRVTDIRAGQSSTSPRSLTAVGSTLFFYAGAINELWTLNGQTGALARVRFISAPLNMTALNSRTALFRLGGSSSPDQLWKSDGTDAGTVLVKSFDVAPPSGLDRRMALANGLVYFAANTPGAPEDVELWRTDGTAAGTVRVKEINPGEKAASTPVGFTAWGDRVFFSATDPAAGRELWVTDGTDAGTHRVKDVNPGPSDGLATLNPGALWGAIGDRFYFTADDGTHGAELWSTDGTEPGTAMVYDAAPGERGSAARFAAAAPDRVVYFANDGLHGIEPWAADLRAAPPATVMGRYVFYNHSSYDGNDAGATPADDNAIATDKVALLATQDALPTFANVTSFDKGLNGVMIDIAGLPNEPGDALTANDFNFNTPATPVSVTVRRGAGVTGSDRVTLIWRDYNPMDLSPLPQAVANGWLIVTVKANGHTGLANSDSFIFGNLVAETGDAGATPGWRVNALDVAAVKRDLNKATTLATRTDFNRDGRVNALDVATVKKNLNHTLPVPVPVAVPATATAALPRRLADEVLS
jgi:ELWxxDGT repeat protein